MTTPWSCWLDHVFHRGPILRSMGYFSCQMMGITCCLLRIVCSIDDSSVMCLFNTDSKGLCSATSSPVYILHIWRLPLIGGKHGCLDSGKSLGLRVRQICAGIPLCHVLAFELGHRCGRHGTSLHGPWWIVTICSLLVVIVMVMLCGHSHFLLLLAMLCVHGLEHWLCAKRAIWSLDLFLTSDRFLTSDPCFFQMHGDGRNE